MKITNEEIKYVAPLGVTKAHLPKNNEFKIEVGDDLLVIGYPQGYYDKVNLHPIVKQGIISSGWRLSNNFKLILVTIKN